MRSNVNLSFTFERELFSLQPQKNHGQIIFIQSLYQKIICSRVLNAKKQNRKLVTKELKGWKTTYENEGVLVELKERGVW